MGVWRGGSCTRLKTAILFAEVLWGCEYKPRLKRKWQAPNGVPCVRPHGGRPRLNTNLITSPGMWLLTRQPGISWSALRNLLIDHLHSLRRVNLSKTMNSILIISLFMLPPCLYKSFLFCSSMELLSISRWDASQSVNHLIEPIRSISLHMLTTGKENCPIKNHWIKWIN